VIKPADRSTPERREYHNSDVVKHSQRRSVRVSSLRRVSTRYIRSFWLVFPRFSISECIATLLELISASFRFVKVDLVDIDFSGSLTTVVERRTTNLHPRLVLNGIVHHATRFWQKSRSRRRSTFEIRQGRACRRTSSPTFLDHQYV
jgi:hypothetical protein